MQETGVGSLGWEDPLEKEMAMHTGTLAWRIPWIEEHGRLQSVRSQRIRHDWECAHTQPDKGQRVKDSSVQSLSHVWLFATPCTAAHQASLSITNSGSLLKLISLELVKPSNYLIFCRPLLFQPPIFPSIRVFSNESILCIRWPKY